MNAFSSADRAGLHRLQTLALQYFLDNQTGDGLVLDRQSNRGPTRSDGLCSLAATGMGLIAYAVAAAPPWQLVTASEATRRVRACLRTALDRLPHDRGVVPHFVDAATGAVVGHDAFSTVETAWLAAGAGVASEMLGDGECRELARRFYDRIDWAYWTAPDRPLLRHGKTAAGRFLDCCWDRVNGETAFMIVLAAGAAEDKALPAGGWFALSPCYETAGGYRFNNADLGLFVFQYGLDLLDFRAWRSPCGLDLWGEARLAALANRQVCRDRAREFATYQRFWGLSAGDGPVAGDSSGAGAYRCYSPSGPIDGTAHLTAALASLAHVPEDVLENLAQAEKEGKLSTLGRYGHGPINVGRRWAGRDMVGIDAGAAVLALDNVLCDGRVRRAFHEWHCVGEGLARLGFSPASPQPRLAA